MIWDGFVQPCWSTTSECLKGLTTKMTPKCTTVRSTTPKRVCKRLRSKTKSACLLPAINRRADFNYQVLHFVSKQNSNSNFATQHPLLSLMFSPSDWID